jgi:phage anti-repressor protein
MELRDYLIKYSTISTKFINDFYSFYTNEDSEFKIDLDIISDWLQSRKDHLKTTLKETYTKKIDYIIIKIGSNGKHGAALKEKIYLTPDCFKRLCMMSRTKKAEEVRTYFIQLEKHIDKYKDYIINGLSKRIGILENNQKAKPKLNSGVVYVLKALTDIDGLYRIGKTKRFANRIKSHNSSHPDDMEIILVYETEYIDEVETCLKNALKTKQYRRRKEFYEIDIDILKQMLKQCECVSLIARKKQCKKFQDGGLYLYVVPNNNIDVTIR